MLSKTLCLSQKEAMTWIIIFLQLRGRYPLVKLQHVSDIKVLFTEILLLPFYTIKPWLSFIWNYRNKQGDCLSILKVMESTWATHIASKNSVYYWGTEETEIYHYNMGFWESISKSKFLSCKIWALLKEGSVSGKQKWRHLTCWYLSLCHNKNWRGDRGRYVI